MPGPYSPLLQGRGAVSPPRQSHRTVSNMTTPPIFRPCSFMVGACFTSQPLSVSACIDLMLCRNQSRAGRYQDTHSRRAGSRNCPPCQAPPSSPGQASATPNTSAPARKVISKGSERGEEAGIKGDGIIPVASCGVGPSGLPPGFCPASAESRSSLYSCRRGPRLRGPAAASQPNLPARSRLPVPVSEAATSAVRRLRAHVEG